MAGGGESQGGRGETGRDNSFIVNDAIRTLVAVTQSAKNYFVNYRNWR
jgi:hypothetical protein